MSLLMFLLFIHQIVSMYGELTNSVKIRRVEISGKHEDSFWLPKSYESCISQNECNRFNANLSRKASSTHSCLCSCSRVMAATFGVKNGSWQCIGNKEIRERELDDCERIRHLVNEKETDPLRMFKVFKVQQSMALDIGLDIQCSEKSARFSYQACNGGWKPLSNSASAWGLQVTKNTSNSVKNYLLKIHNANRSEDLHGKVMKLAIPCGSEKPFCWLFKVAGYMTCPLKHILATSIPSKTRTKTTTTAAAATTTTTTKTATTTKAVFSVATKRMVLTATNKVPISTYKPTNLWTTDSDIETINKASHEVSIPLITGTAGSALIVLLVALFIGLLMCRKRKERHLRKRSTSLELKTTKTDGFIDQYSLVEEKARYQSLSPSPDGAMERGVYVSRYKVPETTSDTNNRYTLPKGQDPCRPVEGPKEKPDCDEYDYAQSSLVVRKNVPKFRFPASDEKVPNSPEDNVPFYHVLDSEGKGIQNKESSEYDCGKPDGGAPYYRVLEGPNDFDTQNNFHEQDHEGAHNELKEQDPYYHILEGSRDDEQKEPNEVTHEEGAYCYAVNGPTSSSGNQDNCGYKDLQSDGHASTGYQALHKYAYVTCGDSADSRYK